MLFIIYNTIIRLNQIYYLYYLTHRGIDKYIELDILGKYNLSVV